MSSWFSRKTPPPEHSDHSDSEEPIPQPPSTPTPQLTPLSEYTQRAIAASEVTEEQRTQLIHERRQQLVQEQQAEQGESSNTQPPLETTEFIIPLDEDDEERELQQALALSLPEPTEEDYTEPEPI